MEGGGFVLFCFPLSTWKNDVAISRDGRDSVIALWEEEHWNLVWVGLEVPIAYN